MASFDKTGLRVPFHGVISTWISALKIASVKYWGELSNSEVYSGVCIWKYLSKVLSICYSLLSSILLTAGTADEQLALWGVDCLQLKGTDWEMLIEKTSGIEFEGGRISTFEV